MSNLAYQDSWEEETWEEDAWKDKRQTEWIDGKSVSMAPAILKHNVVGSNIFTALHNFLKGKRCKAFMEFGYVHFSKKDKYIPDVMVVCNPEIIKDDGIHGVPDLIIEVLSPSTAKFDKGHKKDIYEKHGVKEYWIVSVKECNIEVYLLQDGKYVLDDVYTLLTDNCMKHWDEDEKQGVKHAITPSIFPELSIKLEDIFDSWIFKQ